MGTVSIPGGLFVIMLVLAMATGWMVGATEHRRERERRRERQEEDG